MNPLPGVALSSGAHLALSALVILWDIYVAGRITRLRETPRVLAGLAGLVGLLIIPALFIVVVTASLLTGRALYTIAWIWPVVTLLALAQAWYATRRRLAAPSVGIPIIAYDLVLTIAYGARYLVYLGVAMPHSLLAVVAAQTDALALAASPAALLAPYFVHVPILAPASPGRPGLGTAARGMVAVLATVWLVLIMLAIPSAYRAVRSYDHFATERLQERPNGDFTVGLKVFPTMDRGVSPLALSSDLALADSIGAGALSVYLTPGGTTPAVLDSLARALDDQRPGKQLFVALDFSGDDPVHGRDSVTRYLRDRAADVRRIAQHVRPDYIVPVVDPYGAAAHVVGRLEPDQWARYLTDAATAAHAADRDMNVVAHVGGFTARDSALYAWAARPSSPIDAVAFSIVPSYSGGAALDARMRIAGRWLRTLPLSKEAWVLEAGGFPLAHGEASQEWGLWGALAWATSQPSVRGLIVRDASDYGAPRGLRAAGGRLRPAAAAIARATRSLAESSR